MEIEELHVKEICTRQNKINMHVPNTLVQFEIVMSPDSVVTSYQSSFFI